MNSKAQYLWLIISAMVEEADGKIIIHRDSMNKVQSLDFQQKLEVIENEEDDTLIFTIKEGVVQ